MKFPGRERRAGFLFFTAAQKSKGTDHAIRSSFFEFFRRERDFRQTCGKAIQRFDKNVERQGGVLVLESTATKRDPERSEARAGPPSRRRRCGVWPKLQ
jgi:hypothetical protein